MRYPVRGISWLMVLALAAPLAAADDQAPAAQLRAATAAAISTESERNLQTAFSHLYNLEFGPAMHLFEQVARTEKDSATASAFYTSALLYQILAMQGTLQSQLFVTTNEFVKQQRVPPDPELDRRYNAAFAETERRAAVRLGRDPQDVDARFGLGLIKASHANYLAGVKAEYLKGLRAGEEAFDLHTELRKSNPEVHDAGVILGVHDYIIGTLPRTHRLLLLLLGARGDRERGLKYVEEAAQRGEFLRTYSKILLFVANVRDEQLERAVAIGNELRATYPRNPIFILESAKVYRQMKRFGEAAQLCQHLVVELSLHPHNPRLLGPEDGLLELAMVEADQGNLDRALTTFAHAVAVPGANPRVMARARLERGKLLDLAGRRDQAMAEYDHVISMAADPEFTRLAKAYRKRPYRPEAKG